MTFYALFEYRSSEGNYFVLYFVPPNTVFYTFIYAVVCNGLSGKAPHRQVGVGRVMTSGSHWPGMQDMWVGFPL